MIDNNQSVGVHIDNVSKSFTLDTGSIDVLNNINIDINPGDFISIVGASGCGKSTLLKMIGGLQFPSSGKVVVGDRKVEKPSIEVGMIFQESRLFPWLTVEENIEFGIHANLPKDEKKELIKEHIKLVGLEGFDKALPKQLSGGMQQRVSIARTLMNRPKVLLLDEPFGALDALTRINMQNEIINIWQAEKTTMILVTHDIDEAIYLGDRVIVLSSRPGEIKRDIKVNLDRPRERNSLEFVKLRKEIYGEFFNDISGDEFNKVVG